MLEWPFCLLKGFFLKKVLVSFFFFTLRQRILLPALPLAKLGIGNAGL